MSKHRSVRAVLASAAAIALAGCGASAGPSADAPGSIPAGATSNAPGAATSAPGAASNVSVPSGSIPFPVAVGNTWVYQTTAGVNGVNGLITNTVVSVVPVPEGRRVTMAETVNLGGAARTTQLSYVFYADGKIEYPVSPASGVPVVGGNGVLWPAAADLASGRAYRSVLRVRAGTTTPARYENANVTVRGGGTEPVTVPAGTYQATLVDMVLAMRIGSFATSVLVKTWTAPRTGPVKSQVYVLAAGKTALTATERLLAFTGGAGSSGGG